ncbi:PHP domain-containing protein [Maledivibacter halophilus]|uniref:Putative hydrolase n=1 Tax=Maledivibacter halophilus TaxID=36842 RepID=A0A1T5JKR5_9FIRM|nr:PHP domain-containing protein [Maledivibacter halophilus]SKC51723.1 putative hydrolase [Maledivibacter halophilus]
MKIFADYHTHSIYSGDAKGTIKENVDAAKKKGLRELAITDHGPKHLFYGVKKNDIKKIRKEINEINRLNTDIEVKFGLEANIIGIDGKLDVDGEIKKELDILLAGFHFGSIPDKLIEGTKVQIYNLLSPLLPSIERKSRVINTKSVVEAIYKNDIDILTHPGAKASIDTKELAKAAVENDTALEINSSHGYMTVEYIKIAMKEGAKFVISSDAHKPEDIGRVEKGINRAIQAGLSVDRIINAEE